MSIQFMPFVEASPESNPSIDLDDATYEMLQAKAERDGLSVNDLINRLVVEFFESPIGQAIDDPTNLEHAAAVAQIRAQIDAGDEFDRVVKTAQSRACRHRLWFAR